MSSPLVVLTPSAQVDLDSIQDYLLARSADASRIVGRELEQAFARIAEFPQMGHVRLDFSERPVRFWTVFSYLIVYDPEPRPIRILRIIHASRNVRDMTL